MPRCIKTSLYCRNVDLVVGDGLVVVFIFVQGHELEEVRDYSAEPKASASGGDVHVGGYMISEDPGLRRGHGEAGIVDDL